MKKIVVVLFLAVLLIALVLYTYERPAFPELSDQKFNSSGVMKIYLNDRPLDVYTMHYGIEEEYAVIPLTAFLMSIGAEYADSPLNTYETECFDLMGERYVVYSDKHLFMLEEDYLALLDELDCVYTQLSRKDVFDRGLLPFSDCKICSISTHSGVILTDHISLMKALKESGIDITIEYDYSKMILDVILISPGD